MSVPGNEQPVNASATSALELYMIGRAQVEHENTLVGQRITWYLTFQGLLFTALFVAIGLFDGTRKFGTIERQHLVVAVYLIGVLGLASSLVCFALIRVAYAQIAAVETWWQGLARPVGEFPPLTGTGGRKILGYPVTAAEFLFALCLVWLVLMFLFFDAARQVA